MAFLFWGLKIKVRMVTPLEDSGGAAEFRGDGCFCEARGDVGFCLTRAVSFEIVKCVIAKLFH